MCGGNNSHALHTVQGLVLLQSSQGGRLPLTNPSWVSCPTPGKEAVPIHRTQQQPSTPQPSARASSLGTTREQRRNEYTCFKTNAWEELKADLHFLPLTQTLFLISSPCTSSPTCYCCPYSNFWLLPQPSYFPHPLSSSPPFFWTSSCQHQVPTYITISAGHGDPVAAAYRKPVLCSLERIRLCHSSSKFTTLSVTIKKAFTLPDEGENHFGQTGEVGGKRIALVVRRSHNWVEIVLSTAARHTTLAEVILSPNNFRQRSQKWKHQLTPCLFPPKINFPAIHP